MKKIIFTLLLLSMTWNFASCDIAPTSKPDNVSSAQVNSFSETSKDDSSQAEEIEYISDRRVQYDDVEKQQIVFFGLQTESGKYVSSSGVAKITITDESDEVLFQQDIRFSSADFSDWTNQMRDESKYLCGLYINDSDMQKSASNSGTLSLKVELDDGSYFSEDQLYISDLPTIEVNIILPELPVTYKDSRYYSYVSTVEIEKISYTSEVNYDGTATLDVEVMIKLLSKTVEKKTSSEVAVGYKIYDSEGIVVDSGHIYSNPIGIGEISKESFMVFDLDPRETYTMTFMDAS